MIRRRTKTVDEHRRYIRLSSIFPVEYILTADAGRKIPVWQQGYTCNVGKGGICLATNRIDDRLASAPLSVGIELELRIRVPLFHPPVKASARVVWMELKPETAPARYHVGLAFTAVDKRTVKRLLRYARWHRWSPRLSAAGIVLLLSVWGWSAYTNIQLQRQNTRLVRELVATQRQESVLSRALENVRREKTLLVERIDSYTRRMEQLTERLEAVERGLQEQARQKGQLSEQLTDSRQTIDVLRAELEQLGSQRDPLQEQYARLIDKENMINDEMAMLARKKEGLQSTVWQTMLRWLKLHQSPITGLVKSFEGDVGVIQDWAFIYDQALAVNCFLLADDNEAARSVLNFFLRAMDDEFAGFYNGYFYDSGAVSEYTVHCGPNIWVGLAMLQYAHHTGDKRYVPAAETIADWLISIQEQDPEGGLRGGPRFSWFATEHNLDAYAFFDMLHRVTGKEKYAIARRKTLSWLKKFALVKHSPDYNSPPVNRGRGDATIATDTFAWSLAALGPETLADIGMDPEKIMNFAEEHCRVRVEYQRPSGVSVKVEGFDFAKVKHMPRGGLISPEWTSQMVISFQMLGDYFQDKGDALKASYYRGKARHYLNELNKMIIASPSPVGQGEGCLPYASLPNADTGHGWRTPRGDRTGSIAGTAYMMMAIKDYNPLMFNGAPADGRLTERR